MVRLHEETRDDFALTLPQVLRNVEASPERRYVDRDAQTAVQWLRVHDRRKVRQ